MATEQIYESECVGNSCKERVTSNTPPPPGAYHSPAAGHVAARLYHIDPVSKKKTLEYLNHLRKTLESKYELKTQMIGPHPDDQKPMKVLGRIVSYHDWGIQYESDTSHLELALKTMNMVGCKTLVTPWLKESVMSATERGAIQSRRNGGAPPEGSKTPVRLPEEEDGDLALDHEDAHRYMSVAARLNFVSLDQPRVMYAVKKLMRKMTSPTILGETRLTRVRRLMSLQTRVATRFLWEDISPRFKVECDSDFAGCVRTRKSTPGGVVDWGNQFIKGWSKTCAVIALSIGEAELAAIVRASAEGLGLQSVLVDFGQNLSLEVHSDATAAIGIVKREGLGRVRHLAVADLWIQQKQKLGVISYHKVPGPLNSSEVLTKRLDADTMRRHLATVRQYAAVLTPS